MHLRASTQPPLLPPRAVKYAVNTETGEKVAIKILDKDKIQKQNMGAQIKKEVRGVACADERARARLRAGRVRCNRRPPTLRSPFRFPL
jgi:hypothetical protein